MRAKLLMASKRFQGSDINSEVRDRQRPKDTRSGDVGACLENSTWFIFTNVGVWLVLFGVLWCIVCHVTHACVCTSQLRMSQKSFSRQLDVR